jgi:hypothetical protein
MMALRSIGSCRSSTLDSVIAVANTDVEKANDVEIPTLRLTIDAMLTSTNVSLSFDRSCGFDKKLEQDRMTSGLRTQISLNAVTDL